jgi:Lon protease-like protein
MRIQSFWIVLTVSQLVLGYAGGFFCLRNLGDNRILRVPAALSAAAGGTATNGDDPRGDRSLILPIFPLRKAVRLPTETLTLNLYEERYLAMSEYVLESDQQWFGALFSSDKPQVVKEGGMGKIVPMIQPGDIGTIFVLQDSEELMIPKQEGALPRRQIRLVGRGAARFQIQRILHNGYGDDSLPFIIAEAMLLHDDHSPFASDKDRLSLESNLWDKAIKMNTESSSTPSDRNNDESINNKAFLMEDFDGLVEGLVAKLPYREALTEKTLEEMKAELRSYALASVLIPDSSSKDRLEILRMCSARSRLNVLDASIPKAWSLWEA